MPVSRTLTVAGYFKNLAAIAEFMKQMASDAGLSDRAIYAVQMAVDEACTNIIEHGYQGMDPGSIILSFRIQPDRILVRPFDPDQILPLDPQAPLSERKRRGMGMFFINNLMDRADYKFNTSVGNQLILFKGRKTNVSNQSTS